MKKAFTLRPENEGMKKFLLENGIDCKPFFLWNGTVKGNWRLYNPDLKWTKELREKLTALGFVSIFNEPLGEYDGNGGVFSVYVRGHNEFIVGVTPPKNSTL